MRRIELGEHIGGFWEQVLASLGLELGAFIPKPTILPLGYWGRTAGPFNTCTQKIGVGNARLVPTWERNLAPLTSHFISPFYTRLLTLRVHFEYWHRRKIVIKPLVCHNTFLDFFCAHTTNVCSRLFFILWSPVILCTTCRPFRVTSLGHNETASLSYQVNQCFHIKIHNIQHSTKLQHSTTSDILPSYKKYLCNHAITISTAKTVKNKNPPSWLQTPHKHIKFSYTPHGLWVAIMRG